MRLATVIAFLIGGWQSHGAEAAPSSTAAPPARFAVATTLATDCVSHLAVTDRAVFWVTKTGISTRTLPDGPTTELVHRTEISNIVASSDMIWFSAGKEIERVGVDGSHRAPLMSPDTSVIAIAVDDRKLYWVGVNEKGAMASNELWSVPRTGGQPRRLGQDASEIAGMVASGNRLYMITSKGGVSAIPKTGGAVEHVAFQTLDLPRDIAANDSRVVWASGPQATIEQIMSGRNSVVFEDRGASTEAVAITPDGRVVFAMSKLQGGADRIELKLLPASVGKPVPRSRATMAPIGDAKAARRLVGIHGWVSHIAVNTKEAFWIEYTYENHACALRALTLP